MRRIVYIKWKGRKSDALPRIAIGIIVLTLVVIGIITVIAIFV